MFQAIYKLVPSHPNPRKLRFLDRVFFTLARGMFPGIYQVWAKNKDLISEKDASKFLVDRVIFLARKYGLRDFCSFAALSISTSYRAWLKQWSRDWLECKTQNLKDQEALPVSFRGYERRYNCPPPMCRSRLLNKAEQPFKFRRCGATDCKYCRFRSALRMHKRVYNIAVAFGEKHLIPLLGTAYHLDFVAYQTTNEDLRAALKKIKARLEVHGEIFGRLYNTRIYRVKDKSKGFFFRCSILLAHTPVFDTAKFKQRFCKQDLPSTVKVTRSKTVPLASVLKSAHLFSKVFSPGYYIFFKHYEEKEVLHNFSRMKIRLTRSMSFSKSRWQGLVDTFFSKRKRLNTSTYVTKFKRLQLESSAAEIPQSTD